MFSVRYTAAEAILHVELTVLYFPFRQTTPMVAPKLAGVMSNITMRTCRGRRTMRITFEDPFSMPPKLSASNQSELVNHVYEDGADRY
jgi:hypothetical protein